MSESSKTEVARIPEAEYWRGEDTQIKNHMNQHRNSLELLTENHSSQVQDETPEDWTKISSWGGRRWGTVTSQEQFTEFTQVQESSELPLARMERLCCLHRKLSRDTKRVMVH